MLRVLGVTLALVLPVTAHAQVSGQVVDGANQPIDGARVSVQATELEALTDVSGNFTIPNASGDVVVVAAYKGHFYDSAATTAPAAGISLQLEAVPADDDAGYVFNDGQVCGTCHLQQYSEWVGSPMADAGVNTWVYDIYDGSGTPGGDGGFVYTRDSVQAGAHPESDCRPCHQPEGWVYDVGSALAPLDTPDIEQLHGVTCEMCHKMANIDISKPNFPGIWPGVVTMTRPQAPGFPIVYGVLGDVTFQDPMTPMRAAYQPQLVAELCAACHQDKNDHDLDGDFEDPGGVISEPTYLEWAASAYADPTDPSFATCVDCHMRATGAGNACVVNDPALQRPMEDVRSHRIEGTTPEYLENAVTMTLDVREVGGEVEAQVTIDNDLTGHHVPTGVTIRNMILVLEATRVSDAAVLEHTGEQSVHDLGGVGDPSEGYYAGLPGKLYAKLNHDQSGVGPTFFTDATGILFDNRIPAMDSDTTTYTFAVPADGGTMNVRAMLIYRRSWRALVDAKGWSEDGHGNPLADVSPPYFGHLMEDVSKQLDIESTTLPPDCIGDDDCDAGYSCESEVCVADEDDPPPPSGSSPETSGDGCDCRLGLSESHGGWAWFGLLVMLAARSRRRGRQARSLRSVP